MSSSHKVDVGGLLAGGRQELLVEQQVPLEPFEGTEFPRPATVRLHVHAVGRRLEVTGSIDVEARHDCDRCLGTVNRAMHVDVEEQLDAEGSADTDPFGESNVLAGDRLDVKDLVSQLVYSAAPMGVLCTPECRGLCPQCGENMNASACSCTVSVTENV